MRAEIQVSLKASARTLCAALISGASVCPAFDQDGPAGVRAIDLDPGIRGERDPCGLQAQAQILAQEVQHDPLGVPLLGGTPRRRRVTGILTDGHAGRGARLHGPCLGEIRSFTILWSEPRKRHRPQNSPREGSWPVH